MHEIALDVQVTICTPENKKMTIGNIATSIRKLILPTLKGGDSYVG